MSINTNLPQYDVRAGPISPIIYKHTPFQLWKRVSSLFTVTKTLSHYHLTYFIKTHIEHTTTISQNSRKYSYPYSFAFQCKRIALI